MILFVFGLPSLVVARYLDHRDVNAHFLDCYDYIIVGGGVSGMVVGNRLTENQDGRNSPKLSMCLAEVRSDGSSPRVRQFVSVPYSSTIRLLTRLGTKMKISSCTLLRMGTDLEPAMIGIFGQFHRNI